jgi:hypothetical protein
MDEGFEALALSVRADADGFSRDVEAMRQMLADGLGRGADAAGRGIESALRRAAQRGRIEFEDLARVAARALGEVAAAALKLDGGGGVIGGLVSGALGLPGRATGGPVAPGRAYLVGERGPELFVPTSSGRVEAGSGGRGPVSVTVNVSMPRDAGPAFMRETGRQVARDVRRALARLD